MQLWQILLLFCLVVGFPDDCTGQSYAIMAPRIVRPHSTYEVMVTNVAKNVQRFRCEIVNSKDVLVQSQLVRVEPNRIEQANISTGSLAEGNYKLRVWNQDRNQLLKSTELTYTRKSYVVLFQTDKPLYKPGDKVQLRVLFLLPSGKPVQKGVTASIFITDAKRYRMKQWTNATLQSGVFEGSFHLAPHTTLGPWSISAVINEQHYTDSFNVAEYVLPLFKVEVWTVPKVFHCQTPQMGLKISASYMGGGMVRGNATVVVRANYNNYPSETKEFDRKVLTFNGSAVVHFPTAIVARNCDEERKVWFDVEVTDSLTGDSYSLTRMFKVHSVLYNMETVGDYQGFHPGVPMDVRVQLSSVDGLPEKKKTVLMKYRLQKMNGEVSSEMIAETVSVVTNSGGFLRFRVNTTEDTSAVTVEGYYKNSTFQLLYVEPFYEDASVEYLSAYTGWIRHNVTGGIRLYLQSNVEIKRIFYIGYCRRTVCVKGSLQWDKANKRGNTYISANPRMAPHMQLLVFTVMEDGKILSTAIIVRFEKVGLDHFKVTSIKNPRTKAQPERLNFSINAETGAFVGLLGVDERITLSSSSSNDVTLRKMEKAMQSQEDSMELWSAYDSFGSVGVELLTDGYLPDVGMVPHSFGFRRSASLVEEDAENVRQDFPETWIWESLIATNGQGTFEKRVPDTVTTWAVTGFSVGEEHGLVILNAPVRIRAKKDVYAQLHVPAAIKQDEQVEALCLIHNNGNAVTVRVEGLPNMTENLPLILAKGETKTVPFRLVAQHAGELTLKVVLRDTAGKIIDAMLQRITVHPAGKVKVVEDVRMVNFVQHTIKNISLALSARDVQPGCSDAEVQFSVIGNIVNLNQFDLERMVTVSYGNGEENLLFLQTAIAVYEYLDTTGHLSESRRNRFVAYMEVAYQQHFRFRLADGSFSILGTLRECGSTWFTAATVETLLKASAYLSVDSSVITEGLRWVAAQRRDDGSFRENCTIAHPHIQSTGGKELSLAASVMFAFIGHQFSHQYTDVINKTILMLTSEQIEDVYVLAKTSYLLSLLGHPKSHTMRVQLNKAMKQDGVYRFWRVEEHGVTPTVKTRNQGATAYGLLANLKNSTMSNDELLQVAQWIQQNSFVTDLWTPSFEKMTALRALKALHDYLSPVAPQMMVVVESQRLPLNINNLELLRTVTLQNGFRNISVTLKGTGLIVMKLSYRCTIPYGSAKTTISASETNGQTVTIDKRNEHPPQSTWNICVSNMAREGRSELAKLTIYYPTGLKMVEQSTIRDELTLSATSVGQDTQLELIYNVAKNPNICFTVKALQIFQQPIVRSGFIKICLIDAKDDCQVYPFN